MKLDKVVLSTGSSIFLNMVRLVACEAVVFGHFLTKYQPVPYDPLFIFGSTIGGSAVLLFFALSGLLVSYSLLHKSDDPQYGFRSFFVDRFSRIYSGLVPALLFSGIIAAIIYTTNYTYYTNLSTMQSAPSLQTFTLTLFMLQRFPVAFFNGLLSNLGLSFPLPDVTPFGFNGILWTLVVEWWIYLFFGALVIGALALVGKRRRSLVYRAVSCVAIVMFGLLLVGFSGEFGGVIAVWFVGALMTLALGSSALKEKFFHAKWACVTLAVCLAVAAFAFCWTYASAADYSNVYLGLSLSLCLFFAIALSSEKRFSSALAKSRIARLANFGAGYSYTLFLTHYPIIIFLNGLNLLVDRWIMLLPILLITNAVACAVAFFTEKKSRQLAAAVKKLMRVP
ncbi:acyltransferase [Candidatus Bathyarchaeota archaeon]|nr:acyltransferase [Candidatus Bathyarchaeota archaeon]